MFDRDWYKQAYAEEAEAMGETSFVCAMQEIAARESR